MKIYNNFNKYLLFFSLISLAIITSKICNLNGKSFDNRVNHFIINFLSYIGIFLPSIYFTRENKQKKMSNYVTLCAQFYAGVYCMLWIINIFSYLLVGNILIPPYLFLSSVGFIFHTLPITILPLYYRKQKRVLKKNGSSLISLFCTYYSGVYYYSKYHGVIIMILNFIFLDVITTLYLKYNYKIIPEVKFHKFNMNIV
jgi:hypothetical protein